MAGRPVSIREEDILDAARAVFLEHGLEATTGEIARRAGVSEGIIFHRYKTKEALFVEVVGRSMDVPVEFEQLAARVGHGELAEHLNELGMVIIKAMQTVLPLMMMAWASPAKMAGLQARMNHPNPAQLKMIRLLSGYFEAEARRGRIRPVDPEILARAFFGGVVDYVMSQFLLHTSDSLPMAGPTFLRGLINILLDGVLPRAEARVRRS